jgi:hypothetical protein
MQLWDGVMVEKSGAVDVDRRLVVEAWNVAHAPEPHRGHSADANQPLVTRSTDASRRTCRLGGVSCPRKALASAGGGGEHERAAGDRQLDGELDRDLRARRDHPGRQVHAVIVVAVDELAEREESQVGTVRGCRRRPRRGRRLSVVTVRDSKFGKSGELQLHATTVTALREYLRDPRRAPARARERRSVDLAGRHPVDLLQRARDLPPAPRRRKPDSALVGVPPRVHDLRHRFAVQTLLDWYQARRRRATHDAAAEHVLTHSSQANVLVSAGGAGVMADRRAAARGRAGGHLMSALAPTVQAFFAQRLTEEHNAPAHRIAATATRSDGSCVADRGGSRGRRDCRLSAWWQPSSAPRQHQRGSRTQCLPRGRSKHLSRRLVARLLRAAAIDVGARVRPLHSPGSSEVGGRTPAPTRRQGGKGHPHSPTCASRSRRPSDGCPPPRRGPSFAPEGAAGACEIPASSDRCSR